MYIIKYVKTIPITPMMMPTLAMPLVSTNPVAWARAFGGVLIGRLMPSELAKATETKRAVTPPKESRDEPKETPTAAMIGIKREAVAV